MNAFHDGIIDASPSATDHARRCTTSNGALAAARRAPQTVLPSANWNRRAERWGCLMVTAQGGEKRAYEQLLRELDGWLRRYYARRLPRVEAEDATQDALLAIHAKQHTYVPSKPFGPWVAAIARHKWIDRIREAYRFATVSLHDEIAIENPADSAINAIVVDGLLKRLTPAQAHVIRLVKLQGVSIEDASFATGQSTALVKVNIHRGLKKLTALAAAGAALANSASAKA